MSEDANAGMSAEGGTSGAAAVAQAAASAGQLLRAAREAAGMDLASLAVALKVSAKKLEALESDRFEQLPDAVFLRGLASSVCRALKIDATPILARLPQSTVPRLDFDDPGLNTPFRTPGDEAKMPFWDKLSRPLVLAAVAVLMGALVLIFFPYSEQRAEIGSIVNRGTAPSAGSAAVQAPVTQTTPAASTQGPQPSRKEPVAASPAVATGGVQPAAVGAQPAAAKPAQMAKAGSEPQASVAAGETAPRKKFSSTGIVVFKTSDSSWVEVTDGNGAIQLSRLLEAGDTVGVSGPLPLNVTVGRADATEVTVRGKPFPLESLTRQGVAHFEVK